MAFNLTKEQCDERRDIVAKLRAAHDELTAATIAYNEALSEMCDFVEAVANDQRSAFDEKSERWQESDTGQEVDEWIQSFENLEAPDQLDEPDETFIDDFENVEDRRPMSRPRKSKGPTLTIPVTGVEPSTESVPKFVDSIFDVRTDAPSASEEKKGEPS